LAIHNLQLAMRETSKGGAVGGFIQGVDIQFQIAIVLHQGDGVFQEVGGIFQTVDGEFGFVVFGSAHFSILNVLFELLEADVKIADAQGIVFFNSAAVDGQSALVGVVSIGRIITDAVIINAVKVLIAEAASIAVGEGDGSVDLQLQETHFTVIFIDTAVVSDRFSAGFRCLVNGWNNLTTILERRATIVNGVFGKSAQGVEFTIGSQDTGN